MEKEVVQEKSSGLSNSRSFYSICSTFTLNPNSVQHPGEILLPPTDLLSFPTLPASVMKQISFDAKYYDYYGKYSAAFEDSMIDAPQGKAKRDYEDWLRRNPDVHAAITKKIKANYDRVCNHQEQPFPDMADITDLDIKSLVELSNQMLYDLRGWKEYDESPLILPDDWQNRKRPKELTDLLEFNVADWQPGKDEKEDRQKLFVKAFAILRDADMSVLYKAGAIMLLVT